MKQVPVSFLILIFIFNVSVSTLDCTEDLYVNFLTSQGREPDQEKSNSDYYQRFQLYCERKSQIQYVNNQALGYTLKQNRWMDWTDAQVSQSISVGTTVSDLNAAAEQNPSSNLKKVGVAPSSVDYRISGDVSSIKDQGSCGCCWSFTVTGLYQSWMMLKGQNEYDLSEQYILECTSKYTYNVLKTNANSTCSGGYVDFAGDLARRNGIPLETTYPYKGKTYTGSGFPTTDGICQANLTYLYGRDPNKVTFTISRNQSNSQMKQLIANGPVGALIYANTLFQAYSSGVFTGCPTSFDTSYDKINHAVIIVGYDSSGNYIIKNSWSTAWGSSGFGIVSKDADCGLSAFAYQYSSNSVAGTGLQFTGQVSLSHQNYLSISIWFLALVALISLIF